MTPLNGSSKKSPRNNYWILFAVIGLAILARWLPHMPNVAPITALGIFAGAYLPFRRAVIIPLAARLLSDIILGFFSWPLMVAVYGAHAFGAVLGMWVKGENGSIKRWGRIAAAGGISATVFFLVTNFAFLYANYPHTWTGIIASYTNGLPFVRGTLLGDVGYSVGLFFSYECAIMWISKGHHALKGSS